MVIFIVEKKSMGGEMSFCPLMRSHHLLQFWMGICFIIFMLFALKPHYHCSWLSGKTSLAL